MISEKQMELINREIDGVNSAAESEELKKIMAENPEAKAYYDSLEELSNKLGTLEDVEPSPHLTKHIMNSIPAPKTSRAEKKGFFKSLFSVPQYVFKPQYASVFAGGLVFGLVLFFVITSTINPTGIDLGDIAGTLISRDKKQDFENANSFKIHTSEAYGRVDFKQSKELVLVEINLRTNKELELLFEFDSFDISFNSFKQFQKKNNGLAINSRYVKFTNNGDNKYLFLFNSLTQNEKTFNFKMMSQGRTVMEKSISVKSQAK